MVVRIGDVVVPSGTSAWPHELATAKALAMAGHDVEFLPRIDGKAVKSADVLMDGVVWEMKSPTSTSVKSLQKQVGNDYVHAALETLRVVRYLESEELWVFQRRFVHYHRDSLGLDALHDALSRTRAEVVRATLHGESADADERSTCG